MIGIINREYEQILPLAPSKKALTVFNFEDAKLVFREIPMIEFVICLNEKTMKFGYCYNLMEAENFYTENI